MAQVSKRYVTVQLDRAPFKNLHDGVIKTISGAVIIEKNRIKNILILMEEISELFDNDEDPMLKSEIVAIKKLIDKNNDGNQTTDTQIEEAENLPQIEEAYSQVLSNNFAIKTFYNSFERICQDVRSGTGELFDTDDGRAVLPTINKLVRISDFKNNLDQHCQNSIRKITESNDHLSENDTFYSYYMRSFFNLIKLIPEMINKFDISPNSDVSWVDYLHFYNYIKPVQHIYYIEKDISDFVAEFDEWGEGKGPSRGTQNQIVGSGDEIRDQGEMYTEIDELIFDKYLITNLKNSIGSLKYKISTFNYRARTPYYLTLKRVSGESEIISELKSLQSTLIRIIYQISPDNDIYDTLNDYYNGITEKINELVNTYHSRKHLDFSDVYDIIISLDTKLCDRKNLSSHAVSFFKSIPVSIDYLRFLFINSNNAECFTALYFSIKKYLNFLKTNEDFLGNEDIPFPNYLEIIGFYNSKLKKENVQNVVSKINFFNNENVLGILNKFTGDIKITKEEIDTFVLRYSTNVVDTTEENIRTLKLFNDNDLIFTMYKEEGETEYTTNKSKSAELILSLNSDPQYYPSKSKTNDNYFLKSKIEEKARVNYLQDKSNKNKIKLFDINIDILKEMNPLDSDSTKEDNYNNYYTKVFKDCNRRFIKKLQESYRIYTKIIETNQKHNLVCYISNKDLDLLTRFKKKYVGQLENIKNNKIKIEGVRSKKTKKGASQIENTKIPVTKTEGSNRGNILTQIIEKFQTSTDRNRAIALCKNPEVVLIQKSGPYEIVRPEDIELNRLLLSKDKLSKNDVQFLTALQNKSNEILINIEKELSLFDNITGDLNELLKLLDDESKQVDIQIPEKILDFIKTVSKFEYINTLKKEIANLLNSKLNLTVDEDIRANFREN